MLKQNLKRIRKQTGLTQQALAQKSGVSMAEVQYLEQGRIVDPSMSILKKLSKALNVTIDELVKE